MSPPILPVLVHRPGEAGDKASDSNETTTLRSGRSEGVHYRIEQDRLGRCCRPVEAISHVLNEKVERLLGIHVAAESAFSLTTQGIRIELHVAIDELVKGVDDLDVLIIPEVVALSKILYQTLRAEDVAERLHSATNKA